MYLSPIRPSGASFFPSPSPVLYYDEAVYSVLLYLILYRVTSSSDATMPMLTYISSPDTHNYQTIDRDNIDRDHARREENIVVYGSIRCRMVIIIITILC